MSHAPHAHLSADAIYPFDARGVAEQCTDALQQALLPVSPADLSGTRCAAEVRALAARESEDRRPRRGRETRTRAATQAAREAARVGRRTRGSGWRLSPVRAHLPRHAVCHFLQFAQALALEDRSRQLQL